MENTFFVSLDASSAASEICREVVNGSISGELIDEHIVGFGDGRTCHVLVFEKYYYRVSNRLTLTVTLDNASGKTRVHSVSGGGGQNILFRFDWGASDSFANSAYYALQRYIVQ